MDLTIYSIGDAQWLFFVLQGVARIFDYNNSPLAILVGSSAAIGLISLVVSTWVNPQVKPLESWFIGMVIFMILLGPLSKTNVTIESVRDGSVYSVDDVPAIASIAGFATSSLMYGLSTAFEDNWGNINGFRAGQFLDPYRALLKFDDFGIQMAFAEQAGKTPENYAIEASLQNYMKDCIMWDIEQGGSDAEISKSKIINGNIADLWSSLKVTTPTRSTLIAIDSPPAYVTCPNAYNVIDNFFNSADFNNMVNDFMAKQKISNEGILTATEKVSAGSSLIAARNLATSRVLADALASEAMKSDNNLKLNQEIIIIQAKAQRHYQMSADRELWLELAVGFATFLEGFVYFMMPIMAIMMVLGGQMAKALMGFFAVSIWVSLWPVTMVAVNFFTDYALEGAFAGTETSTALSFGMFSNSKETIRSYLAVSSSLAAAVPMLSMYVLHRGVHTMMGVGGKAAPNTSINQSNSSPDLAVINGGVATEGNVKTTATTSSSDQAGVVSNLQSGSSSVVKSVDAGTANTTNANVAASQNSVKQNTHATANATSAKEELSQSRSKSADKMDNFVASHGDGFTTSDTLAAGLSNTEAASVLTAQKQAIDNGVSTSEQVDLNRQVGLGVKATAKSGGGTPGASLAGSLDASGSVRVGSSNKKATSKTAGTSEQTAQQNTYQAEYKKQLSAVDSEMKTNTNSYGESRKRSTQQSEVKAKAVTTSQQQQQSEAQMTGTQFNLAANNQEVVQSSSSNLTAKESLSKFANSLTPAQASKVNEENGFKMSGDEKFTGKANETPKETLDRELSAKAEPALKQAKSGLINSKYTPQMQENAAALSVMTDTVQTMNNSNKSLDDYGSVDKLEAGNNAESGAKKAAFNHIGNEYNAPSFNRVADQISTSGIADNNEIKGVSPSIKPFDSSENKSFEALEAKNSSIPTNDISKPNKEAEHKNVQKQFKQGLGVVSHEGERRKDETVSNSGDINKETLAATNTAKAGLDLADNLFGGSMISAVAANQSIPAIDKAMPGEGTFAGQGFQLMALAGGDVGKVIESNPESLPLLHMANTPQGVAAYEKAKERGDISPETSMAIDAGMKGFQEYKNGNDETQSYKSNEQAALYSTSQGQNDRDAATTFSVANGGDESNSWYETGGIDDKSSAIYSGLHNQARTNGVDIPNDHYNANESSAGNDLVTRTLGNEKFHTPNFEAGSSNQDRNGFGNSAKNFGEYSSKGVVMNPEQISATKNNLFPDDWSNMNKYTSQTEAGSPERVAAQSNMKSLAMASSPSNGGNGSWDSYASTEQNKAMSNADIDGNTELMINNVLSGNGNFDNADGQQVEKVQQVIESLSTSGVSDRANQLEQALNDSGK